METPGKCKQFVVRWNEVTGKYYLYIGAYIQASLTPEELMDLSVNINQSLTEARHAD